MSRIYYVALLALCVGISQANSDCSPGSVCHKELPDFPDSPPSNSEEFAAFCRILVPFFDCLSREAGKCDPAEHLNLTHEIQKERHFISHMCNEDSLLYKALAENVECISTNQNAIQECSLLEFENLINENTLKDFIETLSTNGVKLTKEEIGNECPSALAIVTCMVARADKLCGDVVKAAILEIIIGMDFLYQCVPETTGKLGLIVDILGPKLREDITFQSYFLKK